MSTTRTILLLGLTTVAACAQTAPAMEEVDTTAERLAQNGPPGSVIDNERRRDAWAELSLVVDGPAASDGKREACLTEARAAGVWLRGHASVTATLSLADEGNRVSFDDGRPQRFLGKWRAEAVCRVAIAVALKLDERIPAARDGRVPNGCRVVGNVDGQDAGYMGFGELQAGSYESALAKMRFAAVRMGSNFLSVDLAQQSSPVSLQLSGRAFSCEAPPTQAALPPGSQI